MYQQFSYILQAEDKQRAAEAWSKLLQAFDHIGVTGEEVKAIVSILAAIYHLGNAGAVKGEHLMLHLELPLLASYCNLQSAFTLSCADTHKKSYCARILYVMQINCYFHFSVS